MKKEESKEKTDGTLRLLAEIKAKEEEINLIYYQLGKKIIDLVEKEEKKINKLVDEVIEMKRTVKEK